MSNYHITDEQAQVESFGQLLETGLRDEFRPAIPAVIWLFRAWLESSDLRPAAQPVGEPVASIPNDGPSTYEQRFTDAVRVICGVTPPAELVRDWIGKTERRDDLQQWVGSYAPGWVQNIAILDAAHVMATQPTEGGTHHCITTPQPVAVPDRVPMTDEQMGVVRFLLGESGIDGCHFGDMNPDKRGRFWWRDNLRSAFGITAPSNQPTSPK